MFFLTHWFCSDDIYVATGKTAEFTVFMIYYEKLVTLLLALY